MLKPIQVLSCRILGKYLWLNLHQKYSQLHWCLPLPVCVYMLYMCACVCVCMWIWVCVCTYVCACIWVTLGLALPRNLFCLYHPIFLRTIACKCSLIWGTLITWLPAEIPGHAGAVSLRLIPTGYSPGTANVPVSAKPLEKAALPLKPSAPRQLCWRGFTFPFLPKGSFPPKASVNS